jgi:hypothetical protein
MEVANFLNEFGLFAVRTPVKPSSQQVEEAQQTGQMRLEPEFHLVLPPTMIPGLIRALTTQKDAYERKYGAIFIEERGEQDGRHRVVGSGAATQDVVRYAPPTSTDPLRAGDVTEPVARPRLQRREGQEKRIENAVYAHISRHRPRARSPAGPGTRPGRRCPAPSRSPSSRARTSRRAAASRSSRDSARPTPSAGRRRR